MGNISTGLILARTWLLLRSDPAVALATLLLLTGLSVILDQVAQDEGARLTFVDGVATLIAQYVITRRLVDERWTPGDRPSILPVLGLLIVSGIGIFAGLALLVVPGIILLVRWFPAVPLLMARNDGVMAALSESWEITKGSGVALFGVACVVYAPTLAAFVLIIFGSGDMLSLTESLVTNLLITVATLVGWYAAVAFCELSAPGREALEEVFA